MWRSRSLAKLRKASFIFFWLAFSNYNSENYIFAKPRENVLKTINLLLLFSDVVDLSKIPKTHGKPEFFANPNQNFATQNWEIQTWFLLPKPITNFIRTDFLNCQCFKMPSSFSDIFFVSSLFPIFSFVFDRFHIQSILAKCWILKHIFCQFSFSDYFFGCKNGGYFFNL